jgi:hypothetical protein
VVLNKIGVNPFCSKKELDYLGSIPYMIGDTNINKRNKESNENEDEIFDEED